MVKLDILDLFSKLMSCRSLFSLDYMKYLLLWIFSVVVQPGEAVGLVGVSGCGKSTVALGVMQDLGLNGKVVSGSIKFKGRDLGKMSEERLRDIRGNEIAMIYQEPMASLNPAIRVGKQLTEVPMIHDGVLEKEA